MAPTQSELCVEMHKNVNQRLDGHDDHFKKVDDELDILKGTATRTETVVQNLCEQIKSLVEEMKNQQKSQQHTLLGIAGAIILLLAGFLFWYIQSLPR